MSLEKTTPAHGEYIPHIIVKMYPNRSQTEKIEMAERLARDLHENMGYALENVSVSVVEVPPSEWMDTVYEPDMVQAGDVLVRRPGYGPLADGTGAA